MTDPGLRPPDPSPWHGMLVLLGCALAAGSAAAQPVVDTSEWKCEFCPFEDGTRSEVTAGLTSVSDDTAFLGDASGLDEEGVYLALDATGSYAAEDYRLRWSAEDLGVDARAAEVEGGSPGRYDYRIAYRELPRRAFITTRTVFVADGDDRLRLPDGYVRAPATGDMSTLAASLVARDIGGDRRRLAVGAGVELVEGLRLSADYRRQEHDGVKIRGGALFTSASLLPLPFDYRTDEAELALAYAGERGRLSLGWYLSDFGNLNESIAWDSPFTTVAGADTLRMARAPDNKFQQLRLSAGLSFPAQRTWLSLSAASGRIEQDQAFLPYTINPDLAAAALPAPNLAGEVDTANYALAITSTAIERVRLRASYRYDERDNRTPQSDWGRVIVDSFASGEVETNRPYSFRRTRLGLEADYDLLESLRVSAGIERREHERDFQEVAEQTEDTGWGRVRWQALPSLQLDARAGSARREIDRYDESLAAFFGQNPLLRKYNLAFRYRRFGDLAIAWAPAELPVSLGLSALLTDDSYTRSELGMTSGDEQLVALDFGWTLSANASVHASAGLDRIESTQRGSQGFGAADWDAAWDDRFLTLAAGFRLREIGENLDLEFDYLRSDGSSELKVGGPLAGAAAFPDIESDWDSLRAGLTWRRSETLSITAELGWQRFETEDWALRNVAPATIPVVLTLGAAPWDEEQFLVTVGARYRFGTAAGR